MEALFGPLQYAILPVFAFAILGFILGRVGEFSRQAAEGANQFMVGIAVPALQFRLISGVDFGAVEWDMIAAYLAVEFSIYGFGFLVMRYGFRVGPRESVLLAMTAAFPNHVYVVLPIVERLYGPESVDPVASVIVFDIVLMFGGTILFMEAIKGEQGPLAVLKDIATNRLIVVIALGFAWNFSGLALHEGFAFFLDMATASATPVALFSLGVILSGHSLQTLGGPVWAVVALKNLLMPLLAVIMLGTFLAPSPAWEAPALLTYGAPSGVLAFVLGLKYGVKVESIAKAVILSTALSILTAAIMA